MNKVTYGLKNAYIHRIKEEEGVKTLEAGIPVPGITNFTPSAEGSEVAFYADDVVYYYLVTNDGYNADVAFATIPDQAKVILFGWEFDTNGVLVETADVAPKPFAFSFEVAGDKKKRRMIYYNCVANRPAKAEETKGATPTINTEILPMTIKPVEIDGRLIVKGSVEYSEETQAKFDAWFTEPTYPTFGTTEG